jgi:hypothetical protein
MEDTAMINLWKSYDRKLEEVLLFSRQHAEELTRIKVRSFLTSMTPIKIFTIITGILWVGFIDVLLVGTFAVASPFFLVSLGIQVILTKLAIGVYLYQLTLIHRVDISEPILATQEKIARLQSSTIWVTRLLFLQLPIWTTFYLSKGMFQYGNTSLIILQVFITLLFTFMAVWLFLNIKYENRNKKWFRLIFKGKEWDPMIKSMELLGQIHEYRK